MICRLRTEEIRRAPRVSRQVRRKGGHFHPIFMIHAICAVKYGESCRKEKRQRKSLALERLRFVFLGKMAVDINAAQQGENQRQRGQAKDFKIDPNILRQPERDVDIRKAAQDEKDRPRQI